MKSNNTNITGAYKFVNNRLQFSPIISMKGNSSTVTKQVESPIFDTTSTDPSISVNNAGCGVLHCSSSAPTTKTVANYTHQGISLTTSFSLATQHFMDNECICEQSLITNTNGDDCSNNSVFDLSRIKNGTFYISAIVKCDTDLTSTSDVYAAMLIRYMQNNSLSTHVFKSAPRSLSSECKVIHLTNNLYEIRFGSATVASSGSFYSARLGLFRKSGSSGTNIDFELHDLAIGFALA